MSKKNIFVKSFGCSSNFGEGEVIKGLLQKDNFEVSQDENKADLVMLNVCTVKGNSSPINEIKELRKVNPNQKIVVGGCVTRDLGKEIQALDENISITTTNALPEISKEVDQTLNDQTVFNISSKKSTKANLPKIRQNPVVGIVNVSTGCLDRCAFCSTVQVKGKLLSYPEAEVLKEVRDNIEEGCQEIWLTGQDAACWGFEFESNLARLVESICEIPGDFKVRIGMGNPRHLLIYIDELVQALKHPKVFKFIHLPVQAGCNEVLKSMKRQHSVEDYLLLVEKIKAEIPEITISTDIIVGFPGETDGQFEKTLDILKATKPSVCNRTRYVPRPGTVATTYSNIIPMVEKKRRSKAVTDEFKKIVLKNNEEWIGWSGEVLIDEKGKGESWIARNYAYKQIILNGPFQLGQKLEVKIHRVEEFALYADVLNEKES